MSLHSAVQTMLHGRRNLQQLAGSSPFSSPSSQSSSSRSTILELVLPSRPTSTETEMQRVKQARQERAHYRRRVLLHHRRRQGKGVSHDDSSQASPFPTLFDDEDDPLPQHQSSTLEFQMKQRERKKFHNDNDEAATWIARRVNRCDANSVNPRCPFAPHWLHEDEQLLQHTLHELALHHSLLASSTHEHDKVENVEEKKGDGHEEDTEATELWDELEQQPASTQHRRESGLRLPPFHTQASNTPWHELLLTHPFGHATVLLLSIVLLSAAALCFARRRQINVDAAEASEKQHEV